jgi:hypothetical protein
MRNSPSPERRPPEPQTAPVRGWIRGLTVILIIGMVALLAVGLWALGKNDFGLAFASLTAGAAVTFLLLALTLLSMRRPRG